MEPWFLWYNHFFLFSNRTCTRFITIQYNLNRPWGNITLHFLNLATGTFLRTFSTWTYHFDFLHTILFTDSFMTLLLTEMITIMKRFITFAVTRIHSILSLFSRHLITFKTLWTLSTKTSSLHKLLTWLTLSCMAIHLRARMSTSTSTLTTLLAHFTWSWWRMTRQRTILVIIGTTLIHASHSLAICRKDLNKTRACPDHNRR